MDNAGIEWQRLDHSNWSDSYPYKPRVTFRIAHTGTAILLHYDVEENAVRAEATADNGAVWEDSCCEMFLQPEKQGGYYNIECNCAGTLLMGYGTGRSSRDAAAAEQLDTIDRWASLGRGRHPTEEGAFHWQIALVVPVTALFRHHIAQLDGTTARCNIYKCGDRLPRPHFLSWMPVGTDKPDFHRPEFFGACRFE